MQYKISDIAKQLGTSPDLIRYYEKRGLVRPKRDAGNDYRRYDGHDVNILRTCFWLRGFGFSLESIGTILSQTKSSALDRIFLTKERELEDQIRHLSLLLDRVRDHRAGLERIDACLGRYDICERPAYYWFTNRLREEANIDRGQPEKHASIHAMGSFYQKVFPFCAGRGHKTGQRGGGLGDHTGREVRGKRSAFLHRHGSFSTF